MCLDIRLHEYSAHSSVDGANLVLRHSLLSAECWRHYVLSGELNAALCLDTSAMKLKYIFNFFLTF